MRTKHKSKPRISGSSDGMAQYFASRHVARRPVRDVRGGVVVDVRHHAPGQYRPRRLHRPGVVHGAAGGQSSGVQPVGELADRGAADVLFRLPVATAVAQPDVGPGHPAAIAGDLRPVDHRAERAAGILQCRQPETGSRRPGGRQRQHWQPERRRDAADRVLQCAADHRRPAIAVLQDFVGPGVSRHLR
ncbi:hypothetical protein D3C87_979060 [compost metagenome]